MKNILNVLYTPNTWAEVEKVKCSSFKANLTNGQFCRAAGVCQYTMNSNNHNSNNNHYHHQLLTNSQSVAMGTNK